ncbi:hypothetical protein [Marilutibacter chinensis]|uniref:Uncharacterized protein n=1 Tax=Marilutibacter chinensis TaxID=2912247 RepID=A0ABS9HQJ8_9GAMM|nr:hypothetical protein [Lysobacter chinensis]
MEETAYLVLHCKASDFDAATGECVSPFYGPASTFPPPMDVGEALLIFAAIGSCWGIGYMIKLSGRAARSG